MSLVTELADRAHDVSAYPVPDEVLSATRTHLIDTVGALLAGRQSLGESIERLSDGLFPAGGDARAAMRRTAFAGGVYAQCWEAADIHRGSILCPGPVILPAVLAALAVREEATFEQVLWAYLGGYEVALAAGIAIGSHDLIRHGWWPTALVVPLGAAAAASVLLQRSHTATASAIALAAQQAGGVAAGDSVDSDGRYLLCGNAADRAIAAVLAAESGWRGPLDILEDPRSPLRARTGLPDGFLLPQTSLKAHTCAQHLQAAVDAVLELRADVAGEVDQVICALPEQLLPVVNRPAPFEAALSTLASAQFVLAVALLHGRCTPADYSPETRRDPRVLALASRIRLVPDEGLSAAYPQAWGARVTLRSASGVTTAYRRTAPGDPGNELSDHDIAAKFRALAGPSIGERPAAELVAALQTAPLERPPQPLLQVVLPLLQRAQPVLEDAR